MFRGEPENFSDRLLKAVRDKGTPLAVGVDPVLDKLPSQFRGDCTGHEGALAAISAFCRDLFGVVAPLVPVVKLNVAFFERYLARGLECYLSLLEAAREDGLLVIGDVKRGDIGHTASAYAMAHLGNGVEGPRPDAVTVNGFAGEDGISPFCDTAAACGRGVFVWVRSSNPSAGEIQDFAGPGGEAMYQRLAAVVGRLAAAPSLMGSGGFSSLGMVVGGTSPAAAARLRQAYPHVWFLVPGYGSQGASAADCVRFCGSDGAGALISASRSIIFAHARGDYAAAFGNDWKRCVRQAVIDAKVEIAAAIGSAGPGKGA